MVKRANQPLSQCILTPCLKRFSLLFLASLVASINTVTFADGILGAEIASEKTPLTSVTTTPSVTPRYNSRLNQLVRQKPTLYKPTRLFIGEDNKFVVRVPAGRQVVLLMSPQPGEFPAPNGQLLPVNASHETLEMKANEKGVAVFTLPVPKEDTLAGRSVFFAAYSYHQPDYSDLEVLEILDPTGRPTEDNRLSMEIREDGNGTLLLPGMGGMSGRMMQQLSTLGEVTSDERKKELVDDGKIDRSVQRDQNSFVGRPDAIGGIR